MQPLPTASATSSFGVVFPISAIARDDHPRTNAWAGLAEAGQILAEAEAYKGTSLTKAEMCAVMDQHQSAYDPHWDFSRAGISEAWMSGWGHAFMLYALQCARLAYPGPIDGIGLVQTEALLERDAEAQAHPLLPGSTVRFRHVTLLVQDAEKFWQGIYEGQLAALGEQPAWHWPGKMIRPLTSARLFDDLLDLFVAESGNVGLDFLIGYVLGSCEGLLCGRQRPLAQPAGRLAGTHMTEQPETGSTQEEAEV